MGVGVGESASSSRSSRDGQSTHDDGVGEVDPELDHSSASSLPRALVPVCGRSTGHLLPVCTRADLGIGAEDLGSGLRTGLGAAAAAAGTVALRGGFTTVGACGRRSARSQDAGTP
jgi:hypothetical protein